MKENIVMLAGRGISSNIVFHALTKKYNVSRVIMEDPVSRGILIKKRIKRFGILKVTGQLIFQTVVVKCLNIVSKKRKNEIIQQFELNTSPIPAEVLTEASSVNSPQVIDLLKSIQPTLIVVNGTRIISKKVLDSVDATFINTHAGITPKYRNVHGAYWALVNKDPEHCGVTVHLVDPGIDTGYILYQDIISPTTKDNFTTYPLLQITAGIPLLYKAVDDFYNNQLKTISGPSESRLWYHPTIFQYLYYRITRGVK
ncbi:MAG: hypothetical protein J5I50_06980 [Chitinophagaceae bacterium]|nr:hypothetical protein [Chitinophagaceae bacterium]